MKVKLRNDQPFFKNARPYTQAEYFEEIASQVTAATDKEES